MRSIKALAGADRLERDALFLQQLRSSKCGRVLQDHAACVLFRIDRGGHEGAIEECTNWRRTFVFGLNKAIVESKPPPFGLPKPVGRRILPKYIAIVNLSGERMLVYSEHDTLLRVLCSVSHTQNAEALARALSTIADQAECHGNPLYTNSPFGADASELPRSVLVCYSMQWQAGFESYYWEASTIEATPSDASTTALRRRVLDRQMVLTSLSPDLIQGTPTLGARGVEYLASGNRMGPQTYVGNKAVAEFSEQFSAASLDDTRRRREPFTAEECAPSTQCGTTPPLER